MELYELDDEKIILLYNEAVERGTCFSSYASFCAGYIACYEEIKNMNKEVKQ